MLLKFTFILIINLHIYNSFGEVLQKNNITDAIELSEHGEYVIDDMILSKAEYNMMYKNRNGIRNKFKRWPGKRVVYKFHKDFLPEEKIGFEKCVTDLTANTCIEFVERTAEPSYIYFKKNSKHCNSRVGFQNKVQVINVRQKCITFGKICHEVIHALGFIHEQCSSNRAKYVYVNYTNINPTYYSAFKKQSSTRYSTYGEPYCFESIMHYDAKAFSINGEDTILINEPYKSEGRTIGNREELNDCDIHKINAMYKCN